MVVLTRRPEVVSTTKYNESTSVDVNFIDTKTISTDSDTRIQVFFAFRVSAMQTTSGSGYPYQFDLRVSYSGTQKGRIAFLIYETPSVMIYAKSGSTGGYSSNVAISYDTWYYAEVIFEMNEVDFECAVWSQGSVFSNQRKTDTVTSTSQNNKTGDANWPNQFTAYHTFFYNAMSAGDSVMLLLGPFTYWYTDDETTNMEKGVIILEEDDDFEFLISAENYRHIHIYDNDLPYHAIIDAQSVEEAVDLNADAIAAFQAIAETAYGSTTLPAVSQAVIDALPALLTASGAVVIASLAATIGVVPAGVLAAFLTGGVLDDFLELAAERIKVLGTTPGVHDLIVAGIQTIVEFGVDRSVTAGWTVIDGIMKALLEYGFENIGGLFTDYGSTE